MTCRFACPARLAHSEFGSRADNAVKRYVAPLKEIDGIHVKLATPRALFELKRNTDRPLVHSETEASRQEYDLEDD